MTTLLIVTQCAGLFLIAATMALLFSRRVFLDAQTKKAIEFEFPVFGKMKTQSPVLVLVAVGALMVLYPLSKSSADTVELRGRLDTGGKPVTAIVVANPDYVHQQDASGDFKLKVPLLATNATYRVKVIVDKQVIDDQEAEVKNGRIELSQVKWSPPVAVGSESLITTKKDISDEELRRILSN